MNPQQTIKHGAARVPAVGLASLLALAASLPAIAQIRYEITNLGTLPGLADSYLWQQTINNRGHVATYANNAANPNAFVGDASFLWKGAHGIELLPALPGATDTMALGLNDRDQVVGFSGPDGGGLGDHAVLWEEGVAKDLGTLPEDALSWALYINNKGVVVGTSANADFSLFNAVVWQDGRIFLLPALKDSPNSQALSINNEGRIVGISGPTYHAVLWTHDAPIDLGTLGGDYSAAFSINDRDQIAGQAQTTTGDWHASAWQNSVVTDLGTYGTDSFSTAMSINNRGQIVGFSAANLSDLTTSHALLWENGKMIDLQTRLPAHSGWVLQQGAAINDRGQIGGIGLYRGAIRAFLLTPGEGEDDKE